MVLHLTERCQALLIQLFFIKSLTLTGQFISSMSFFDDKAREILITFFTVLKEKCYHLECSSLNHSLNEECWNFTLPNAGYLSCQIQTLNFLLIQWKIPACKYNQILSRMGVYRKHHQRGPHSYLYGYSTPTNCQHGNKNHQKEPQPCP